MSDEHDTWNDTHRAFLQCLLSSQQITYEESKPILAALQTAHAPDRPTSPADVSEEDFENYIHSVTNVLSTFDFEIRNTIHQKTKAKVYALVNTTSDALTQMATMYSPDEIAFIRRVLEAMFDTYNTREAEVMAVGSTQALRLTKPPREGRRDSGTQGAALQGLTASQAEQVLEHLVAQGWFEKNERTGYYCLSPRALMELKEWLVETFNDEEQDDAVGEDEDRYLKIKNCGGCQGIVTIGQRCPNLDCLLRLHNHCASNFFRFQGHGLECPDCKSAWTDPPDVGERAGRKDNRSRASNGVGASNGGARNRSSMNLDRAGDVSSEAEG